MIVIVVTCILQFHSIGGFKLEAYRILGKHVLDCLEYPAFEFHNANDGISSENYKVYTFGNKSKGKIVFL